MVPFILFIILVFLSSVSFYANKHICFVYSSALAHIKQSTIHISPVIHASTIHPAVCVYVDAIQKLAYFL